MDIERERGITIKSQAVRMPWTIREGDRTGETAVLNMIDTPGHVDFTYEVSRSLAACEGAVLLVGRRAGASRAQTLANLYLALENDLRIIPVLNKIDLPAAQPEKYAEELAHLIGGDPADCIRVSGKTGEGVPYLLDEIVRQFVPPVGEADNPARAMIFDSVYDVYRGVVHVRPGDRRSHLGPGPDQDDVHRRGARAAGDRCHLAGDGEGRRARRRRGGVPDHRREGRPPVAGR